MKQILIKPVISEKSINMESQSKYAFEVGKKTNKREIKKAVSDMYKVDVISVNVHLKKPKAVRYGRIKGFRQGKRIAIVTLKKDQKIEVLKEAK